MIGYGIKFSNLLYHIVYNEGPIVVTLLLALLLAGN